MCVSRVLCGRMIEHVPFSRFLHLSAHSNPRGGLFSRIQGSAFLVLMLHPIAGVAQGTKAWEPLSLTETVCMHQDVVFGTAKIAPPRISHNV